jgi:3',5'-cyclic AMP phosphodiesterase CpdA
MSDAFRVVQISDTHLSAMRAYGTGNFDAVVDWLAAAPPDLVVQTGDIALDDPDDDDDRSFAHAQHERISAPLVAIPGNHDIGDSGPTPWMGQRVDATRVDRFVATWGADRFVVDHGSWRLIGINALLCGELADRDAAQLDWLAEHLRDPDHVAVFLHKPLCLERLDRDDPPGVSVERPARDRLWRLLRLHAVRLVASGHLHRSRSMLLDDGVAAVWAPSTAFLGTPRHDGSLQRCGVIEYAFDGPSVRWGHVEPPGLSHRLATDLAAGARSMREGPLAPYAPAVGA